MKTKKNIIVFLLCFLPLTFTFQSCEEGGSLLDDLLNVLLQTGWLEEDEEMDNIPDDITPFDGGDEMPSAYSIEDKFPPIGNQGSYGTCVVWSVGYNLKTSLNAIEKGWTTTDLSNPQNQTSPKDLWFTIPASKKGTKCEGTNFEPALDALIADGSATMSDIPYINMGNCDGGKTGNGNNKLANYRKIASETDGLTVDNFKGYLSAGRPVAIGAKLGDRFMTWSNSSIISSDTYNNPGMQHAFHAMVLVGYDDSKSAFRVRNSWGTSWGDNGSIWVDYTFFCNSFCFAAFVAQNVNSIGAGTGGIAPGDLSSGYDLLAYWAEDYEITDTTGLDRSFRYSVYNSGTQTIYPSSKWSVIYMLYNATDADEYTIILEDYYTTEFGEGFGDYSGTEALAGAFWNNEQVNPGKKAGDIAWPSGFTISYKMPDVSGKYYLVVMSDGYDKIAEVNEDNNFYFITAEDGKPLEFSNGKILNMPAKSTQTKSDKIPGLYENTETQTLVKPGNLNAYTPAELRAMLLHDKKTGKLDMKRKEWRENGKQNCIKVQN